MCTHIITPLLNVLIWCTVLVPHFQHWSKVKTSGKKPPARVYHATCVLTGHPIHLAVVGGHGYTNSEWIAFPEQTDFSDMWLLDMTNGSWSEVIHYMYALVLAD